MTRLFARSMLSLLCVLSMSLAARGQTTITIDGPNPVCKGNLSVYTVPETPGLIYQWTINNIGNIASSTPNGTASVQWGLDGLASLRVYGVDSLGDTVESGIKNITVLPLPTPSISTDFRVACHSLVEPTETDPNPTFHDSGCIKVCAYGEVTYTANGGDDNIYTWTAGGGTVNNPSDKTTTVTWGAPGTGTLTVTETTAEGCVGTRTICVEIIESPIAHFVAMPDTSQRHVHVCDSTEVIFLDKSYSSPASPIVAWSWDFGDGTYSSAPGSLSAPVTHMFPGPGSYTVKLTVTNSCGCKTTSSMDVTVEPFVGAKITCAGVMCEGDTFYYYTDQPCAATSWTIIGGTPLITASNYVKVVWDNIGTDGYGYVMFDPSPCGAACPQVAVARVPVVSTAAQIQGETNLCMETEYLFRLPQWPSTWYDWSITNTSMGTLHPTDQPNEVTLVTGATSGTVDIECEFTNTLLGCRNTVRLTLTINEKEVIVGDSRACFDSWGAYYNLESNRTGTWVLTYPDGVTQLTYVNNVFRINLPNTSSFYNQTGIYKLEVSGTGFCPPEPFFIRVDPRPATPDALIGPDAICKGVPVEYRAENPVSGTFFAWDIANGSLNAAAGDATYVTLNKNSTGPFTLYLWRREKTYPYCLSELVTKNIDTIRINAVINGDATPCKNTYGEYAHSYAEGESYEWSVFPAVLGSVDEGQNTPNPTILWNENGGTGGIICKMRKCFVEYIDTLLVEVSPPWPGGTPNFEIRDANNFIIPPVAPNFLPQVCLNETFRVSATGWTGSVFWNMGDNGAETDNNLTQDYKYVRVKPGAGPDTYTITAYFPNPSGCPLDGYTVTRDIEVNHAPLPHITGSDWVGMPCNTAWSTTLTAVDLTNPPSPMLNWQWVFDGSNIGGATTNPYSITDITMGPGRYQVIATDVNTGCSQISDTVIVYETCVPGQFPQPVPVCDANFKTTFGCTVTGGQRSVTIKWDGKIDGWLPTSVAYYDGATSTWVPGDINGRTINATVGSTIATGLKIYKANGDSCYITGTTLVPDLPVADFTFARPVTCAIEADVVFTNTSLRGASARWEFGDQAVSLLYNSIRTYTAANIYDVKLKVWDTWGCPDSVTKPVVVIGDQLQGRTSSTPTTPCEGTPVTLNYIPDIGWFQGQNYQWKKDLTAFAVSNNPVTTTTVFESGYYSVYVTDQYGCFDNARYDTVNIVQVPPAEIWGDAHQCVDVAYTLSGFAGSIAGLTYQWYNGSMTPIAGATGPEYTDKRNTAGTYSYYLEVTIPKPGGGTCSKLSKAFSVTVHATPASPAIGFKVNNCAPYEVELNAIPANPGTYHWSNGATGMPVTVPQGGPYQVTYTDQYGCESKAVAMVPRHPAEYLWIFPSGCYTLCNTGSYQLLGPIIPFAGWEYQRNGAALTAGTQYVPGITVSATGRYTLTLDNGYCTATSEAMDVNMRNCVPPSKPASVADGKGLPAAAWLQPLPNPAQNEVKISFSFAANGMVHTLEVYDVLGRLVSSKQPEMATGTWHLPLDAYAPGVYQVVLRRGSEVLLQRKLSVVK